MLLYWKVGQRIRKEILEERRARYGEEIVSTLSKELAAEFGDGYSRPNLFRMVRFAEIFPEEQIVSTLSRQLGWSHFVEMLPAKMLLEAVEGGGSLPGDYESMAKSDLVGFKKMYGLFAEFLKKTPKRK